MLVAGTEDPEPQSHVQKCRASSAVRLGVESEPHIGRRGGAGHTAIAVAVIRILSVGLPIMRPLIADRRRAAVLPRGTGRSRSCARAGPAPCSTAGFTVALMR